MMEAGFTVDPHPLDNDVEHLKSHHAGVAADRWRPARHDRVHIQATQQAMQMKQQASMQRALAQQGMKPPGQPGAPGGGGAGAPQPGATPGAPHAPHRPPGAVHPDRAAHSGIVQMPRRNVMVTLDQPGRDFVVGYRTQEVLVRRTLALHARK